MALASSFAAIAKRKIYANQVGLAVLMADTDKQQKTMTQTAAITSLTDAHTRFGLARIEDEQFFPEWSEELPKITEAEKTSLDVLIPILYEDAPKYIRNEPQRAQRKKEEAKKIWRSLTKKW